MPKEKNQQFSDMVAGKVLGAHKASLSGCLMNHEKVSKMEIQVS